MDKKEIIQYLESKKALFSSLSDKIWDNPETCFGEFVSAEVLCQTLEEENFCVKREVAGMKTAFSASFGKGKPVIAFLGEFDALSGMSQVAGITRQQALIPGGNGHSCGHHLLGVGSLAGALGLKRYLEGSGNEGTVIYFGCPAEEGGSGKTFMARAGCFEGIDCALTWHPMDRNRIMSANMLANYQIRYRFKGRSSHAGTNPHLGRSALDAVELMNVGVQFLREHIIPEARIHYAITNAGGLSPNVVQANAEVLYLIRAPKVSQVAEIYKRVNKIAQGMALATETELEINFVKGCSNIIPNNTLNQMLQENLLEIPRPQYSEEEMEFLSELAATLPSNADWIRAEIAAFGAEEIKPEWRKEILAKADRPIQDFVMPIKTSNAVPSGGSSDVGDVSWNCPTAQFYTAAWVSGTKAHSWQAVAVGKSTCAHKATLQAGQVLAAMAIDLLEHPEKIEAAKAELKERLGNSRYECPIPEDVKPDAPF